MTYKVFVKASARKELLRLDKSAQRRIAVFVERLAQQDNPRFTGKALAGQDKQWRYRDVYK